MNNTKLKIGITQRIINNQSYPEKRDALSLEWIDFVNKALPEATLIPLINSPVNIIEAIKVLQLDGIILSNGNDLGSEYLRDKTEKLIMDFIIKNNIPLLGICRGFQFINSYFNGKLSKNIKDESSTNHTVIEHQINIITNQFSELAGQAKIVVNSFHNQGVMENNIADDLLIFAKTENHVVEGFYHKEKKIIGIQWHPERENKAHEFDIKLFKYIFKQ